MSIVHARHGRALLRGGVALAASLSTLAAIPTAAEAVVAQSAIVTDSGCTTNTFPANDDSSTGPVALPSTFHVSGQDLASIEINNNGYVHTSSFETYFGPFIADLDTRYTPTPVTYGDTTFGGHAALCVNWVGIGIYGYGADSPTNDVQALLVDRSDVAAGDFDVVFNYGRIDGDSLYGYGATAGFPTLQPGYNLPGSNVPGAFLDSNLATGLVHGSRGSDVLGRYVFKVRNGGLVGVSDPDTTITSETAERSADTDPSFTYASTATDEDHGSFECRLTASDQEPGPFATCDDQGQDYEGLADGTYTFEVRAIDSYGHTDGTPASVTFTVDATGPDATFDTVPAALSNDNTPTFAWSSQSEDIASFECTLNRTEPGEPSPWYACDVEEDGTLTNLGDGAWTFEVRGIDDLGNTGDPVSYDFVVDTAATGVTIDTAPEMLGNDNQPVFTYTFDPSEDVDLVECRVYSGEPTEFAECDSDEYQTDELADGEWTFEVRATDLAGNVGDAAAYDFTVDTAAPGVTLTSTPKAASNDNTPSFSYSSDAADLDHFECLVSPVGAQSGSPETCANGGFTSAPLETGRYSFAVAAVDGAGNRSEVPALFEFSVDTVAPVTTITSAPAPVSPTSTLTFGFASDKSPSTFECRLSGASTAAWEACEGSSKTFTGLTDGAYTFEVRATDSVGNTDTTPAVRTVAVNVGKPTITASLASEFPVTEFGWYRSPVTITYTCAGNGSALVGTCPAQRLVPRASHGRTVKASVSTADGDTASVSTTLYIDKGRPKAEIKGFSGQESYTSVPKDIRCKASDPRSGLDDCTISVTKVTTKAGRFIVVRAKATDKAGNVRVVTRKAPLRAA